MPLSKEAAIRYTIIDNCLTDKYRKYPTMQDLIDACSNTLGKEFSVSTIQKDIKAMKEDSGLGFFAPIKFSKSHNGYYFGNSGYTIKKVPLSEDEIEALEFAAGILEQFKGSRVSDSFNAAVEKVLTSLKIKRLEKDKISAQIIFPESTTYFKGYENIDFLVHCIKERFIIGFDHFSYQGKKLSRQIVHPYLLKEHRNRWYLVGYSEKHQAIRLFGLDRIENTIPLKGAFNEPDGFDPTMLFKHAIGVYLKESQEIAKVELQFNPETSLYIEAQPIHSTQKAIKKLKDGSLIVSIEVYPTKELMQLLLSYGADLIVLSPKWLQNELIEEHQNAIEKLKGITSGRK